MKAKDLAEELLKYPEFDVQVQVVTSMATYEHPYGKVEIRSIDDIYYIDQSDMVVMLW